MDIYNFSGGKSSALMTILGKPSCNDIVLFCDTGREHPETYNFIDKFQEHENIEVVKIKHDLGFAKYTSSLPNRTSRMCTSDLKIITSKRWLKSKGILRFNNFIGFRHDEQKRILERKQYFKKVTDIFILNDLKITKQDVNNFWKNKNYTLEIPSILGNCDLCFLKGKNQIINIMSHFPEMADKWIQDEKRTGKQYIKDISYETMFKIAKNKNNLFPLDNLEASFSCSCNQF